MIYIFICRGVVFSVPFSSPFAVRERERERESVFSCPSSEVSELLDLETNAVRRSSVGFGNAHPQDFRACSEVRGSGHVWCFFFLAVWVRGDLRLFHASCGQSSVLRCACWQ